MWCCGDTVCNCSEDVVAADSATKLLLVLFLCTQVVKRFHRNQKHVGMVVVNKVHKQVRILSHS